MGYISIDYSAAKDMARMGVIKAVFFTSDGRDREIYATRNAQLIASMVGPLQPDYSNTREEDDRKLNHLSVFDVQKMEFRKINLNTLYEIAPFSGEVPPLEENLSAFPPDYQANLDELLKIPVDISGFDD